MVRQAEDLAGQRGADLMHRLHRAADRVAFLGRVVISEAAARLHAVGGDAVDRDAHPNDPRRARQCRLNRRPIAGLEGESLVAGVVGPYRRRAGRERGLGGDDCGERLVRDLDQLRRVLCLVQRLGDNERDGVADVTDMVLREQRLRADKTRSAILFPSRH